LRTVMGLLFAGALELLLFLYTAVTRPSISATGKKPTRPQAVRGAVIAAETALLLALTHLGVTASGPNTDFVQIRILFLNRNKLFLIFSKIITPLSLSKSPE